MKIKNFPSTFHCSINSYQAAKFGIGSIIFLQDTKARVPYGSPGLESIHDVKFGFAVVGVRVLGCKSYPLQPFSDLLLRSSSRK